MPEQRPPRVFISYSHDSPTHAARVLGLANDLRRDGIEAFLDQYVTSPPEGWPRWMDTHVRDDDYVVMVCTETYYRRVIGKETPGTGLGVHWEGNLIYNHLYESDLTRFVPVLMDGGKRADIPEALRGASYYFIDQSGGYEGLLRGLFNRPAAEMPPVGERPALPVLTPQWTERPLGRLGSPRLAVHPAVRSGEADSLPLPGRHQWPRRQLCLPLRKARPEIALTHLFSHNIHIPFGYPRRVT